MQRQASKNESAPNGRSQTLSAPRRIGLMYFEISAAFPIFQLCPHFSGLVKAAEKLASVLYRMRPDFPPDVQFPHQENHDHLDSHESNPEHLAAANRHEQSHGAKTGRNKVDDKNNLLAPRCGTRHEVIHVISVRLEHSAKAPQQGTVRLPEKADGHHQ